MLSISSILNSPYIKITRPAGWVKSFFVVAPLFFAIKYDSLTDWINILVAVLAFLAAACSVYVFNDIKDVEEDKKHPVKSKRPIASGEITVRNATMLVVGLIFTSFTLCMFLPIGCLFIVISYLLLNAFYSLYIRNYSVIDVVVLACFYLQRVLMGCLAIDVPATQWIMLATFFLALTIGFAKRYSEFNITGYASSKKNLQGYNKLLVTCLLGICVSASLMTYAIYIAEKQHDNSHNFLTYSIIFVAAGLFRFLQLVLHDGKGGEPEKIFIQDSVLRHIGIAWFVYTIWAIS
ncbi:MAG: UbiA prenyltransferase family protein [Rickettsiales bacterium]